MLTLDEKLSIYTFLDAGLTVAEISKRIRRSIVTIYKYRDLRTQNKISEPKITPHSPKILKVKDFIDSQIKAGITNSTKIYMGARKQGYEGSYPLLNMYVREITKRVEYKQSKHVETEPGEQAQVDWGSFGKMEIGGRKERLYAFVYVLSYSRAMYVEFVVRQNQQTFQSCHMHAFEKLGIPKTILYDNVKTVVLSREKLGDGTKKNHYNPAFSDFAKYYGFEVDLCPPYWPRSKGKVEAGVKYLRNNFMNGEKFNKTFQTLEELNEKAVYWLENIAQQRMHRSTEEKPIDRWLQEKEFLRFPENTTPYNASPFSVRRSTKDALVHYKTNFYSVPSQFSQKKLFVREVQEYGLPYLEAYYQDLLIARHQISPERGKWIIEDSHELGEEQLLQTETQRPRKKIRQYLKTNVTVAARDLSYYDALIINH